MLVVVSVDLLGFGVIVPVFPFSVRAFGVTQGAGSLGRTLGPPVVTAIYAASVAAPLLLGAVLAAGVVVFAGLARRRVSVGWSSRLPVSPGRVSPG